MTEKVKVPLSAPIQAYGDTIDRIELRRPTVRDIRKCGYPFKVYEDEGVEPQAAAICRYISELGGIPAGSVDQMSAADFNAAMSEIMLFFGESPAPTSRPLERAAGAKDSSGSSGSSPDSSDGSRPSS